MKGVGSLVVPGSRVQEGLFELHDLVTKALLRRIFRCPNLRVIVEHDEGHGIGNT